MTHTNEAMHYGTQYHIRILNEMEFQTCAPKMDFKTTNKNNLRLLYLSVIKIQERKRIN